MKKIVAVALLLLFSRAYLCAQSQSAALRGVVTDQSGALVPGAKVDLTNSSGQSREAVSAQDGSYRFTNLPAGEYTVEAHAPQLELPAPLKINLRLSTQTLNLRMQIVAASQQITVSANANPALTTEPAGNSSALTVSGKDLQSLGDDPEDLAADLQALAGPSAGPSGGSVYIDGFSGGEIPSKDSIREVRINQNPFSPEYDTLGYGRIEIITKPGGQKYHGGLYNNFGDSFWNSRNPYAAEKAPFMLDEYGGSLEGPLGRKASFFIAVDGAAVNNGAVINGATLDPATLAIIDPFTQVFDIPQRRIVVSPRLDYQMKPSDTVSVRYSSSIVDIQSSGVGGFNLVSTGFHNHGDDQALQIANTKVLGSNTINELRFQFEQTTISSVSDNFSPQINVLNAFTGGGAQLGSSSNTLNSFELQDYTTLLHKTHTWRFGVRVRAAELSNSSPINFGGTFVFAGGLAPELGANNQPVLDPSGNPVLENVQSIENYRRTLVFQQAGFSPSQIRALGGGASQFLLNVGNPSFSINQEDVGAFAGDDWRLKRNLTVNLGLRYEGQTNIHDWSDFAPRLGFAWAPGGRKAGSNPKTVVRGGFGMFYQRFDIASVLTARRYNGIAQQQYVVTNPDFYPQVPPATSLAGTSSVQSIERLSPTLRAPQLMESALSLERQFPGQTKVALSYVNTHSPNQFLTNDINAPLPGTYNPAVPGSGIYPMGNPNAVFSVENAGRYNQNELVLNVNSRLNGAVSLFGSYVYNRALSNSDYLPPPQNTDFNPAISYGALGVGTFPANPYSMAGEYGPAATDIHNQFNLGGSIAAPWGVSFSPLLVLQSGAPFNITVGQDLFGDTLFNGRPGIAVDKSRPGLVPTAYGLLDPNPIPGEKVLGRNFGRGPGLVLANLRVSKTFAFGGAGEGAGAGQSGQGPASQGPASQGSASQGPASQGSASQGPAPARGGGRPQPGPFAGGAGAGSAAGAAPAPLPYNLTFSMSIRNLPNHTNPGPIVGNIGSPLFGRANQPYGAALLGGTGFSEAADNRRLELQIRFTF